MNVASATAPTMAVVCMLRLLIMALLGRCNEMCVSRASLQECRHVAGSLDSFRGFLGFVITRFVLRVHVNAQLGHSQRPRLGARGALEEIVDEHERGMPCPGEEDSVAHGAGGAGASGADADQRVIGLGEHAVRV